MDKFYLSKRILQANNIIAQLIIVQVIFFLAVFLLNFIFKFNPPLFIQLALPADVSAFIYKPWTILTSCLLHENIVHLFFNMLWLYWIGNIYIDFLKTKHFLLTFIFGCLAGMIVYLVSFSFIPYLSELKYQSYALGASSGIFAILTAAAALTPNYEINIFTFTIRLKYIALIIVLLDLLGISFENAPTHAAHLSGAILGYLYIYNLYHPIFESKKKIIIQKPRTKSNLKRVSYEFPNQAEIDAILDKISRSGYDSLSPKEKETLFKASKS